MDSKRVALNHMIPIGAVFGKFFPHLARTTSYDYSVPCPFHNDTKPSLRIYNSRNSVKCFGACGENWGPVELVAQAMEISIQEAMSYLEVNYNLDLAAYVRMQKMAAYHPPRIQDPLEYYNQSSETPVLFRYMEMRRIPSELVRRYGIRECQGRVVIPHMMEGVLFSVTTRAMMEGAVPKYLDKVGPLGNIPFGMQFVDKKRPVYVAEAAIDALSVMVNGQQAIAVHIRSYGERDIQILSSFPKVILIPDGDEAGYSFIRRILPNLETLSEVVSLPQGEDANSLHTQGRLKSYLSRG